ncbi:MAG: DUF11 domain-containing protein, partial [Clostridia bacterium]|nr:DUF11 domain-containing protein [Clostridia bacterium]
EITPYVGTGTLGGVKPGDEITYEISYKNYKKEKADIVITDKLDEKVEYVGSSNGGQHNSGTVTWTIAKVDAGVAGTVTLTVKVLEGALESNGGAGKVVNGGDTATVRVGDDPEYTLNEVENPVPENPVKQEITPYKGTGTLGGVKPGDEITYEISYKNYKKEKADIVITDKLDEKVEYVGSSNGGQHNSGTVTWTIAKVDAGVAGTVTLTVKVLEGALESNGGAGKVVNGGDTATVQVGTDPVFKLNSVENPVEDKPVPEKKEITPYKGKGLLGSVKPDDEITYEISYENYKKVAADIIITDKLDEHVEFVSASEPGTNVNGTVTWTIKNVEAGKKGTVTLTVKVLESALQSKEGPGKVVNGGDTATVQVGTDPALKLNTVENPVEDKPVPEKKETAPYEGNGVLGAVQVGDLVTYEISYKNYKKEKADIVITDKLDPHVAFASASDGGQNKDGTVIWTLKNVAAGKEGKVTLKVKVLESALETKKGPGKIVNNGETATVKVGNDYAFTLDTVENPVPENPEKKETAPYKGNGELGAVRVGDLVTYEISYRNYKTEMADIVITDKLDTHVAFASASDGGQNKDGTVIWTLKNVAAGKEGKVTLKVKVLESALETKKGPGKIVNNGETATVRVGNDNAFTLDTVENPVPEGPHKRETSPGYGAGVLKEVLADQEITYEISYKNYKNTDATIVITDVLDKNVQFVFADNNGKHQNGTVTWTLSNVPAGKEGSVILKVKVLTGAKNAGKVTNKAKVQVGNDTAFDTEEVINPVSNVAGAVKTGDDTHTALWAVLLILSVLGAGGFGIGLVRGKRSKKEKKRG